MDKLKITFGIITMENTQSYLSDVIESIRAQNIPDDSYEIIIVGNCDIVNQSDVKIIGFDESQKNMWITRKKNIITSEARYENIVYMHDYLSLASNWYTKFLEFGIEWVYLTIRYTETLYYPMAMKAPMECIYLVISGLLKNQL